MKFRIVQLEDRNGYHRAGAGEASESPGPIMAPPEPVETGAGKGKATEDSRNSVAAAQGVKNPSPVSGENIWLVGLSTLETVAGSGLYRSKFVNRVFRSILILIRFLISLPLWRTLDPLIVLDASENRQPNKQKDLCLHRSDNDSDVKNSPS